MQCLKNTPLADYFCSGGYDEDVTQGKVAKEAATVMSKLRSGEFESTNCQDLKREVAFLRHNFHGSEHQDAHEFLVVLMELLHEDLGVQSEVKCKFQMLCKLSEGGHIDMQTLLLQLRRILKEIHETVSPAITKYEYVLHSKLCV
ncbi:Ubiquitin carboxyl-terminal hydrolase 8 [Zootermopsis nevadensis]|uniref:Ubiquitin carboxyl-terminal hydrolase 8 n=1 Tax=Zootermopsis nevadensis TaxID=136037 RepID=A0A067QIU6_ZOONE|nr:Ubiquitin carboxyl-terminal hydrolase 8 [Zootermopsis nevadensis]